MNYYILRTSLNENIIGKYAQTEKAVYTCDVWNDPLFIDHENVHFKKIDFEPITAKAILVKKAKPTDLISASMIGFTRKLLVSGKLKDILQQARPEGFQFYNSPVIYKGIELNDYWVMNPYVLNPDLVDFTKTNVFLRKSYSKNIEQLSISTYQEFETEKKRIAEMGYPYSIFIEKPKIVEDSNVNFLVLEDVDGGIMYIASEYLKGEIEDAGITGIEFMPTTSSFHDWLARGGEREKMYGRIH